jgi:ferredoxin-like protein FixX
MPCYLCNAIQQNTRGASAGDHLVQSGPAEVTANDDAHAIAVTHYKCSECGSKWRYVDDPANPSAGWQFVQRAR